MLTNSNFDGPIVHWLNDYAPLGVFTTDTAFVIRGWNRWLEQITSRSAGDVIGLSVFAVFPELVERGLDRPYREALMGQVTVLAHRFHKYLVKLPASPEYGLTEMQQSARISPLIQNGQVVGTITAIDDVSERVVRENELMAAREAADAANRAKDRFLAVLSHDLRTPLAAILGWAGIFRDRAADEQIVRKGAAVIERNAAVQLHLIEQILDISRITAAKLELSFEAVNVREMTIATLETLAPTLEGKAIRIDRELPSEGRAATLDPNRFQQIIWNLISNALKFTPDGGWVRVTLKYEDDGFELIVADNGKGIAAASLPHVFEPLWQAEGSTGHGGLGLGLAIVKNLVELHGGWIRAESPGPGQGAMFIVKMPWSGPQTGQSTSRSHSNSHVM